MQSWTCAQVGEWLQHGGLAEYKDSFATHHIDGPILLRLGDAELKEIGVASVGHRIKIVNEVARLNQGPPARPRVLKIAIEGNIAAGKSTFLRILAREMDFFVVQEPVSKWQKVEDGKESGANLLDMFYKDPHRWGYTFQSYAFMSRMKSQMQPISHFTPYVPSSSSGDSDEDSDSAASSSSSSSAAASPATDVAVSPSAARRSTPSAAEQPARKKARVDNSPVVQFFERSVYSDRFCFATNAFESGMFNGTEWSVYTEWHAWLCTVFPELRVDAFIYLRTNPKTCDSRLKKRSRSEEGGVGLDYLETLHKRHEQWLMDKSPKGEVADEQRDTPILVLDMDQEFEANPSRSDELVTKIRGFLNSLGSLSEGVARSTA